MLLAIPALRALRRERPRDELVIAAQPRIGRLLEALGVVDRSVDFERLGLDALFASEASGSEGEWPARCADELKRSERLVAWVGARDPVFVRRLRTLTPRSIVAASTAGRRPVWEHLADTVGAAADDREIRAPIEVSAALAAEARRELARLGWQEQDRLLVVHPGAGGPGKQWPAAGFAEVVGRLSALPHLAVAIHQGPADATAIAALPESLTARAISLREPPLPLLAGVLSLAAAYLGNDSGVSHLAAALGVQSVVLFGEPQLPWRPWAEHVEPLVVSLAALRESDVERVTADLATLLA
ncbi:MAG TPA: glycosyltransferase family 9 protein [Methylomirabilota bacterium]|nr:glycosyltransferase family 9 protein [Methylomirabilota bacterium]